MKLSVGWLPNLPLETETAKDDKPHMIILNSELMPAAQFKHASVLAENTTEKLLETALAQIDTLAAKVKELQSVIITQEQAVQFAQEALKLRFFSEQLEISPSNVLQAVPGVREDQMDLWSVLQRVHANLLGGRTILVLNKEVEEENRRLRRARPIENIGRELKINFSLMGMVEKLKNSVQ